MQKLKTKLKIVIFQEFLVVFTVSSFVSNSVQNQTYLVCFLCFQRLGCLYFVWGVQSAAIALKHKNCPVGFHNRLAKIKIAHATSEVAFSIKLFFHYNLFTDLIPCSWKLVSFSARLFSRPFLTTFFINILFFMGDPEVLNISDT